jgi:hypothetical protein
LKDFYVYTYGADYFVRTLVFLDIFIDLNNILPLDNVILEPMEAEVKVHLVFCLALSLLKLLEPVKL